MIKYLTLTSLLLLTLKAESTSVELGYSNEDYIKTRFYANGVILDAYKSDSVSQIGLGFGFQKQGMQIYAGAGYKTTEEIYVFTGLDWKNQRHSIMSLNVNAIKEDYTLTAGYTYLISETFGFVVEYDTKGQGYFGIRKWIK
jgi:predicted GNAT superfamily acetyltransferase